MKISASALVFLILAAALGPLAIGSQDHELRMDIHGNYHSMIQHEGVHHPTDCCHSHTPRNIRCAFMESYYITSSHCSLPAIIFKTKRGQEVCAKPGSVRVQRCMEKLHSAILEKLGEREAALDARHPPPFLTSGSSLA